MPVTAVRDEGALRMWVCRLPVHIGPADYTVFTEIFGEFVTSQRADVGIGPYSQMRRCIRIRRGFLNKARLSADRGVRPYEHFELLT